eukprot:SAG11_NODE_1945_length_4019_cov_6.325510_1_plen_125_part_00
MEGVGVVASVRAAFVHTFGTPPPTSTSAYFEILEPCVSSDEPRNLHSGQGDEALNAGIDKFYSNGDEATLAEEKGGSGAPKLKTEPTPPIAEPTQLATKPTQEPYSSPCSHALRQHIWALKILW